MKFNFEYLLEFPQTFEDVDARNIREYLKALLLNLWWEGEGFSGKRPFGNSGWEVDLYKALWKAGVDFGDQTNEDFYLDATQARKANELIEDLIKYVFEEKKSHI